MALVKANFTNCFTGGGPAITKIFEIDNTATWTSSQSYVIYSGDGACYSYNSTTVFGTPKQTFLTPDGTNVTGACNAGSGCPSVNTDMYPNNVYYTFSACCDGSTFSFRRGDVEFAYDYVDGAIFYLNYNGTGGSFDGCATVITGYTGSTIYIDTLPTYSYSVTIPIPPYTYFADCPDCELYHPCASTPTPTPTVTATPTVTPTNLPTPTPTTSTFGNGNAFAYTLNITGACETGLGAILITASGGTTPYTFDWYDPDLGLGPYKYNLPAGVYHVRASDATAPVNNEFYITAIVEDYFEVDFINITNTTCGLNNGSMTVSASTSNLNVNYYLYNSGNLISSQSTNNGIAVFSSLSAGTYSVTAVSGGGCTATTDTCIVYSSNTLDFGFYIVNDTQCASPTGKLFVTGVTGNAPFTYLWSDSTTGTSITGLTTGTYSCTVTSADGCVKTESAFVDYVPSVGLGSWSAQTPSCFASDGALVLTITGGTGPYFYSGSNGTFVVTYSQTYEFSGLNAGPFSVLVTDAALCKIQLDTVLQTPNSFYSVQIDTTNSIGKNVSYKSSLIANYCENESATDTTTNAQFATPPLFDWNINYGFASAQYMSILKMYLADIGYPTASYATSGGLYYRQYSKGFALVNPTTSSVTFTFPVNSYYNPTTSSYARLSSASSGTATQVYNTSVLTAPQTGYVFINNNPSPPSTSGSLTINFGGNSNLKTISYSMSVIENTSSTTLTPNTQIFGASAAVSLPLNLPSSGGYATVYVKGIIVPSTTGTFNPQLISSGVSPTVLPGSFMKIVPMI